MYFILTSGPRIITDSKILFTFMHLIMENEIVFFFLENIYLTIGVQKNNKTIGWMMQASDIRKANYRRDEKSIKTSAYNILRG